MSHCFGPESFEKVEKKPAEDKLQKGKIENKEQNEDGSEVSSDI